jgi:hypothetical protein
VIIITQYVKKHVFQWIIRNESDWDLIYQDIELLQKIPF